MAGIIGLLIMIIGWLLVIFAAFGSGLELHLGNLNALETGEVLILLALCIGVAVPQIVAFRAKG